MTKHELTRLPVEFFFNVLVNCSPDGRKLCGHCGWRFTGESKNDIFYSHKLEECPICKQKCFRVFYMATTDKKPQSIEPGWSCIGDPEIMAMYRRYKEQVGYGILDLEPKERRPVKKSLTLQPKKIKPQKEIPKLEDQEFDVSSMKSYGRRLSFRRIT